MVNGIPNTLWFKIINTTPDISKKIEGWIMRGNNLESMSIDELWALHEHVALALAQKLEAEKAKLAQRLSQLQKTHDVSGHYRARRSYPKYRNPANPAEVWSGRGKRPRWLEPQIQAGKGLDDFLIDPALRRH